MSKILLFGGNTINRLDEYLRKSHQIREMKWVSPLSVVESTCPADTTDCENLSDFLKADILKEFSS